MTISILVAFMEPLLVLIILLLSHMSSLNLYFSIKSYTLN